MRGCRFPDSRAGGVGSPPQSATAPTSRRILTLVGLAFLGAVLGLVACAKPPTRPEVLALPRYLPVDYSPAWSRDGRWVAFQRTYWSSYGPPGGYLIPSSGGAPTYLIRGGLFVPRWLSFSPDGRWIAMQHMGNLVVIDPATQTPTVLTPAGYDDDYPDWSPTDDRIVLRRASLAHYESTGVYMCDWRTREVRPVLHAGAILYAEHLRWSPNGRLVACVTWPDAAPRAISVFTPGADDLREVYRESDAHLLSNVQWYVEPLSGDTTILFARARGQRYETWSVRQDGTGLKKFFRQVLVHDRMSPDGRWTLESAWLDTLGLLCVGRTEDIARVGIRRLTTFEPLRP